MKAIKKLTEGILTIIACLAVIMLMAEAETIGMQIICTAGASVTIYVCYRLLEKINPQIFKEDI